MISRTALVILLILLCSQLVSAETWHVTIDGTWDVPMIHAAISVAGSSSFDLSRTIEAFNRGPWLELGPDVFAIAGCDDIYGNSFGDIIPGGVTDMGGNIFLDPCFYGPAGPDEYHLSADSPCLAAQSPRRSPLSAHRRPSAGV